MRNPNSHGDSFRDLDSRVAEFLQRNASDSSQPGRAALEALSEEKPELLQSIDPLLLALREREQAEASVPPTLGGIRRVTLAAHDAISTTWTGWEMSSGSPALLRVLRPGCHKDPVWRRRMARGTRLALGLRHVVPLRHQESGEWPHQWALVPGQALADLLPSEDPPDSLQIARYLGGGLLGLAELHARGLVHGRLTAHHVVLGPDGPRLLWLDPLLGEQADPRADLGALGEAVAELDPMEEDGIGDLARGLAHAPPPNVQMAIEMLIRRSAVVLTDKRHQLRMRSRKVSRHNGEARLLRAVRALGQALPPPAGRVCLRAGHDAVMVVAESVDNQVRGGAVAGLPARHLPVIWSQESGLDAASSRVLLRAFATRTGGDEERRAAVQQELGSTDVLASQICRWLSAQARLRATRRLLELGTSHSSRLH